MGEGSQVSRALLNVPLASDALVLENKYVHICLYNVRSQMLSMHMYCFCMQRQKKPYRSTAEVRPSDNFILISDMGRTKTGARGFTAVRSTIKQEWQVASMGGRGIKYHDIYWYFFYTTVVHCRWKALLRALVLVSQHWSGVVGLVGKLQCRTFSLVIPSL